MTVLASGYVGARTCTDGPTVGAKNLMSWHLKQFGALGGYNLGIYNCRTVRGGSTTSVHGEGRASDLGCPTTAQTWSWDEAEFLRAYSKELGIQCVIHNHPDGRRLIWSCSGVSTGWRSYSGVDHNNHEHAELTWAAANGGLTVALLDKYWAIYKGTAAPGTHPTVYATQRAINLVGSEIDGLWGPQTDRGVYTVRQATKGLFPYGVVEAQTRVGTPEDGDWGSASRTATVQTVRELQAAWGGLTIDGDWGPATEARWKYIQAAYLKG